MSLRALRKLQERQKSNSVDSTSKENEQDSEGNEEQTLSGKPSNRFDLLIGGSPSESEVKEDDDLTEFGEEEKKISCNIERKMDSSSHSTGARRKKKKKKKKGFVTKVPASSEDHLDNELDEIDKSVKEVNAILGETAYDLPKTKNSNEAPKKNIFSVEHKHLNPQNEMKRIFGSWVVQNSENNKRRNQRTSSRMNRGTWIVQGGVHPPKLGISMTLIETHPGYQVFKFNHLPSYQQAEFRFLDAVQSLNPENILTLLNDEPFHINTLLQVSEIFRLADDASMAAQLIERAIHVLECSIHPLFNFSTGTCRLRYKNQENRSFFIALFRHILNVGQKGCYRTALELCKLLLNLSPDDDPLAVSLMLDFYAIRAQEYAWLIALYDLYEPSKNLSLLPNFAFSVPLALFHLSSEVDALKEKQDKPRIYYPYYDESGKNLRARADSMLQKALIMFPAVIKPLLNKCSIQADPFVENHAFFGIQASSSMSKGLDQIVTLFVGRNYHVWKEPEVLTWLEENVREVLKRVDAEDPVVKECEENRKQRYHGTPMAIYRHIIMAEITDVTASLPPNLANNPVMSYDPLPPPDSVCDYSRPLKHSPDSSSASILTTFFRSLLPNYVPGSDDLPEETRRNLADVRENDEAVEGAVGEEGATAGELRASVNTLLDAMRDLLSNIRPPDNPDDADQSEEEDELRNEWQ